MTPTESIAAYELWCASNKSYKVSWSESGLKSATFHTLNGVVEKISQVLPSIDHQTALSVSRIDSVPSYEGYKEWLQHQ